MEIAEINENIRAKKSRIRELKNETRECMWFDAAGKPQISDQHRLETLNDELGTLQKEVADKSELAARLQSILGGQTVAEIEREMTYAENRVAGIKAELDHALKHLVSLSLNIPEGECILGDHLFAQAGREKLSMVLGSPEFVALKEKAEAETAAAEDTLQRAKSILAQYQEAIA